MDRFLSHYTPSLMTLESLEGIFVQRDRLLGDLLDNIEKSVLTEAKHHALLIGPRGIGKTHLISMIYHRVAANPIFKDQLKIAWLREEEWGVATFLDLLVRILNALIDEYHNQDLQKQVNDLYTVSTDQAEQLAGYILRQYCQGQTLLLLMENLDEIFKGLDESGQQAFRAYLQNYGFITIVASSQSLFSGVQSRDLPFYGFFNPIYLKPLSLEEAVELLAKIARWRGDEALADLLTTKMGTSRIRAIHYLAGGNHRIYIIFSQFLTTDSLDSLVEPFMKTLDDLTPFYQSRMQFISPQQRKIIEYLCEQRGAISVKAIAQHCFISPQTASSQLKLLKDMGYVYADSQGRESFYELQEPLMRICLEAKKRRGEPNQLFISFLRIWYCREELENRLQNLPLEAAFDRAYTLQALTEMETSEDPKISALLRDWDDAQKNAKYQKMLEISEELIHVHNEEKDWIKTGMDWIKKGEAYFYLGKRQEAIQALDKAVELVKNNAELWRIRGRLLSWLKLYEKALASYEKSLALNPKDAWAWSLKAGSEARLDHKQAALASLQKAVESHDNHPVVLGKIALAYNLIGKKSEALNYIDQAIALDPDDDWSWEQKSRILWGSDRSEALSCVQKAIAINPNEPYSYYWLSYLLWHNDNCQALIAIDRSLKLREYFSPSWCLKGLILQSLQSSVESVQCLNRSLELETQFPQNLPVSNVLQAIQSQSQQVISEILKSGTTEDNWLNNSQSMLDIYAKHNLLNELSSGLVESIKTINEPSTSDHTAQAWLAMWQNLAGSYPEFQVALNFLNVAVQYKIQKDPRILLQLPQEERKILKELLNLENPD